MLPTGGGGNVDGRDQKSKPDVHRWGTQATQKSKQLGREKPQLLSYSGAKLASKGLILDHPARSHLKTTVQLFANIQEGPWWTLPVISFSQKELSFSWLLWKNWAWLQWNSLLKVSQYTTDGSGPVYQIPEAGLNKLPGNHKTTKIQKAHVLIIKDFIPWRVQVGVFASMKQPVCQPRGLCVTIHTCKTLEAWILNYHVSPEVRPNWKVSPSSLQCWMSALKYKILILI